MDKNEEVMELDMDEVRRGEELSQIRNYSVTGEIPEFLMPPKNVWRMYPLGREAKIIMDFPCHFAWHKRFFMRLCFGTVFERL